VQTERLTHTQSVRCFCVCGCVFLFLWVYMCECVVYRKLNKVREAIVFLLTEILCSQRRLEHCKRLGRMFFELLDLGAKVIDHA
jgi:hypothetical protein